MKQLSFSTLEQAGVSAFGVQRIRTAAAQMVADGITPAQVIFAARRGAMIVHQADGKFGPEPGADDLTTDALFPICSITKLFTATAVMMLVEQGKLGLSRPVSDYVSEFTGEGKSKVCVHHLLTHTSGFDGEIILFEPGSVMSYSGYGYGLLGEIIRRVSGQPYDEFVTEKLFKPLGMENTFYCVLEEARRKVVRRSPEAPCAEWIETEEQLNSVSAGGGAYSTAIDLAVFGQMFLNGGIFNETRILSPIAVKEMTRNQIPGVSSQYRDEVFPEAYWGYGWAINGTKRDGGDLFSPEAYSHWGAGGPFICVDPVYETVTVHFSVELDHQRPFKNMYVDYFNNTVLAAINDL